MLTKFAAGKIKWDNEQSGTKKIKFKTILVYQRNELKITE